MPPRQLLVQPDWAHQRDQSSAGSDAIDTTNQATTGALAKDPSDRFETPDSLLRELTRIGKFNSLEAD